jgi:hypothetical protein
MCIQSKVKGRGAIGSLQAFLGSLGAGAGRPGSHGAMQKLTRSFRLVAHNDNSKARERNSTGWLVGSVGPGEKLDRLIGCQPLMRYGNLFLSVVRIP